MKLVSPFSGLNYVLFFFTSLLLVERGLRGANLCSWHHSAEGSWVSKQLKGHQASKKELCCGKGR